MNKDQISQKTEKENRFKVKAEPLNSHDAPRQIADVMKMFRKAIPSGVSPHPDISKDDPSDITTHLYAFISAPNSLGLILRQGRKPIGMILSNVNHRLFGNPRRYAYIMAAYIDPEFGTKENKKLIWNQFFQYCKKVGVENWEMTSAGDQLQPWAEIEGLKANSLCVIVGGKTELA